MRRLLIVLITALIAVPSLSSADWSRFTPKLMDYYGELEIDARYENNESTLNGRTVKITDMTLVEKINLYTLGYVYHPNFLTYRLNLSGGLREEKFTSTFSELPMSTDPITEYEFRLYFLPSHPYNLELFTVRRTPLTRAALSGVTPVSTSYGATLKYDEKPYGASLAYVHQTTEAGSTTTTSQIFSTQGIWFIGPFVTSAGYQHIGSDSSFNETSSRDYSFFHNKFEVKQMRLTSEVDLTDQSQKGTDVLSLNVRQFSWEERFEQKLPWNFEASIDNRYLEDTTKAGNTPESVVSSRDTRFEISHQLYESLRSRYMYDFTVSQYPQGEIETSTNSLNFSYTKRIPIGIIRAGADYNFTKSDRKGQSIVTSESHTATVIGSDTFTLNTPQADEASIGIMVSTVVAPGDVPSFVELQRDINYIVAPRGNTFLITILSIPSEVCQITDCLDPAFLYTFRASYSSTPGDSSLNTTFYGFNMRFELFNSLISPYFSYYRTKQNVVSGFLNGSPEDSTNTTVGLQLQKMPFIFMVEYQDLASNINPTQALRSELDFRKDFSSSLSLIGKLNYSNTQYPLSQSGGDSLGYTETRYGADILFQKTFFSPRLAASLGASYNLTQGLATSQTYALNTGFSLRIGRTEIVFSGRASKTKVEGDSVTQELVSDFFFLTFKRQFF